MLDLRVRETAFGFKICAPVAPLSMHAKVLSFAVFLTGDVRRGNSLTCERMLVLNSMSSSRLPHVGCLDVRVF